MGVKKKTKNEEESRPQPIPSDRSSDAERSWVRHDRSWVRHDVDLAKLDEDLAGVGTPAPPDQTAADLTGKKTEFTERQELAKLDEELEDLRAALAKLDRNLASLSAPAPPAPTPLDGIPGEFGPAERSPVTMRRAPEPPQDISTPAMVEGRSQLPAAQDQPEPHRLAARPSTWAEGPALRRLAVAVVLVLGGVVALLLLRLAAPTQQVPSPPAATAPPSTGRESRATPEERPTPVPGPSVEAPAAEPSKPEAAVPPTTRVEPRSVPPPLIGPGIAKPPASATTPAPKVVPESEPPAPSAPSAERVSPREEPTVVVPPPPPAVVSEPRPAPPAKSTVDEAAAIQQIREVVGRYELAYDRLDANAAAAIWPSVDSQALARAFARLRHQDLEFDTCVFSVSQFDATAQCSGEVRYVRRIGSSTPRTERHSWIIQFLRVGDQWRIQSVTGK